VGLVRTGVVDHHVEAAEPLGRRVHHRPDRVGVAQVGADHDVTVAGQRGPDRLGPVGQLSIVDGDPVARPGERLRHRLPDPARGTRHQHRSTAHADMLAALYGRQKREDLGRDRRVVEQERSVRRPGHAQHLGVREPAPDPVQRLR